jgi:hypothetical protein
MRKFIFSGALLAAVISISGVVYAMVTCQGDLDIWNNNVRCQGWTGYADTDRTVTLWLRDPSGNVLETGWGGAQHEWERPWVTVYAAPVGSGTYTCEIHFEEFGPGSEEAYSELNLDLYVE